MSELTEAMVYFEDAVKETDEIIVDCSVDLQKELTEQKRHFVVALDAMRRAQPANEPLTNAQKIRAMSDEELAEALYDFEDLCMPDYCQRKKECDDMLNTDIDIPAESCRRCLLDWLRQPAEVVHDGQTI